MRRSGKLIAVGAVVVLGLAGCASQGRQKEQGGTLIGAAGGAVLGAQIGSGSGRILAIAAGTLLGALLGSEIGRSLDKADRLAMADAERKAKRAKIGETITWKNARSGNHGRITPTREGRSKKGRYCREFQQVVVIAGKEENAYGVACRQPDGNWEIVKNK